jgi:hypothetical protein
MTLDNDLVSKAVNFLISEEGQKYAFYLIKQIKGRPVASLMITIESDKVWWIQSVFVIEE